MPWTMIVQPHEGKSKPRNGRFDGMEVGVESMKSMKRAVRSSKLCAGRKWSANGSDELMEGGV